LTPTPGKRRHITALSKFYDSSYSPYRIRRLAVQQLCGTAQPLHWQGRALRPDPPWIRCRVCRTSNYATNDGVEDSQSKWPICASSGGQRYRSLPRYCCSKAFSAFSLWTARHVHTGRHFRFVAQICWRCLQYP